MPRIFIKGIDHIVHFFFDKKRKIHFKKITEMLKKDQKKRKQKRLIPDNLQRIIREEFSRRNQEISTI